jgi:carboxyl-terminal processing protease
MPDEFVPLDTTKFSSYFKQLLTTSILLEASSKYIDENRKALTKKYSDFKDFLAKYEAPQSLLDIIYKKGEEKKIKPKNDDELKATIPYVKMQIKALVARDLWNMNEYYQIMNENNDVVQKALSILTAAQ